MANAAPGTSGHGRPPSATSRLAPPELPADGVTATRAARLLAGSPAPVTLLVAPAGAGKTITLSSWARSSPTLTAHLVWATLDRTDDDVASLWSTLLSALRANPVLAGDPRIAQLSSAPAGAGVDASLIRQLTTVFEHQDPPFVLVLDDVHELTDPACLRSIELLVQHRPAGLALVLSGRHRPDIALHELRLAAAIREIGPPDFSMDLDETRALLSSLGHDLPTGHLETLWRRTEGWAAALRLAALELDRGSDPARLAQRFGGTTPMVAELLATEVLDRLPDELRGFLLDTGPCRELTPTLAEELTGRSDAGAVLEDLYQRNALVQRLPTAAGAQPVYRYHDLLRDYLSSELRRADQPRWRALQGTLANWYGARREWRQALEHAVNSCELATVRQVLRAGGVGMILDGEGPLLERLFANPPQGWQADTLVGSVLAAAALARFDVVTADWHLAPLRYVARAGDQRDEDQPDEDQRDEDQRDEDPWLTALQATVALHRARLGPAVSEALRTAQTAGVGATQDVDLDLYGRTQLGAAHIRAGAHDDARRDLIQALDLATATARDVSRVVSLGNLATIAAVTGRVPECDRYVATALQIARARGWYGSQLTLQQQLLRAWWALLRGDQAAARDQIAEMPAAATLGSPDMRIGVAGTQALAGHLDGVPARTTALDLRAAWELLGDAQTTPEIACMLIPWEVKLWLTDDDLVAATAASRRRHVDLDGTGEQLLVQALLAHASGTPASRIRRSLQPARDRTVAVRFVVNNVWVWLMEAQLAAEAGARPASYDALVQAVRLAAPDGLVGLVHAFGPAAHDLLIAHRGRFGRQEAFVTEVLERSPTQDDAVTAVSLTPAEWGILHDLPTHRTVADIAALHEVSANTVKSHLKSIYRKLSVRSRQEAVEHARARGLL